MSTENRQILINVQWLLMQFKIKLYLKQSVQAVFNYFKLKSQWSVLGNRQTMKLNWVLKHPQTGSSNFNNWFNGIEIRNIP